MSFQPITQVHFCRTGIDDINKVWVYGSDGVFATLTSAGRLVASMRESSFQRAEGFNTIRVDSDTVGYYELMKCDTVLYRNEQEQGSFYIVGNIIGVEWINPGCTYVHFKVDYFMTYQQMIDWEKTYAYVEREHVKEDWAASGNPMFSNIGPDEGFGVQADVPCFTWCKDFGAFVNVAAYSPYDDSGKPSIAMKLSGGLPTSLNMKFGGPSEIGNFLNRIAESKDASINNVCEMVGVPAELSGIANAGGKLETQETLPCINVGAKQNPSIPNYRNAKCWASPFFIIRLMSSDGSEMDFNPQWFGNDRSEYKLNILKTWVGNQFGGIKAAFDPQNSTFNWKTFADFSVGISELPRLFWTADGFAEWNKINKTYADTKGVSILVQTAAGMISGFGQAVGAASQKHPDVGGVFRGAEQVVDSAMSGIEQAAALDRDIAQAKATGAAVQGGGAFSMLSDIAIQAWGFKVCYYGVQPYAMNCIDMYFDRFGYLQNKLKKIEPMTRPIWSFKKTVECHVASTAGVPFIAEKAINAMFNGGVTFWDGGKYKAGRAIGDYSSPEQNRGVTG